MKKLILSLLGIFITYCSFSQIIVNEVEADAGNFEGGGEWIELKNIGASAQDMSCWKLTNGGNVQLIIPQGLVLGAGEYLLIGNASQMMCPTCDYKSLNNLFALNSDGYGYGTGSYASTIFLNTDILANGGCDCMTGSGGFNNGSLSGDRIVLFDDGGSIMDALMYSGGDNYGTGPLTINFPGTANCVPLAGLGFPAVGDPVFNGRIICNDLGGCNSSYARLPDGNNGATVTWAQSGNLACTGCLNPCGASTNYASADLPTPGLDNTTDPYSATLNSVPVTTTNTTMTVCGATPLTFEYQIYNFANAALVASQSTGNLGSYVKINNASPVNFGTATYNNTNGITILTSTVIPPAGTTNYEFVWGDANTNCASCPGSTSTATPNNISSTAKECYVYRKLTIVREDALAGSPTAQCSIPGSITVNGATGTNVQYTLEKQTTTGGPFTTISGPQNGNSFGGIIDDDADPTLPNYQVLVSSANTVCVNPSPIVVAIPGTCLGNPACAQYVTSGIGLPTFTPATASTVCAGSSVQFTVDINGVCTNGQVEVMYDYNNAFDPYTQGTSLGIVNTTVGTTPAPTTATGKVYISEFVPRPYNVAPCATDASNPNSGEYIELYNAGPGNVDISGWMISDGDWTATIPAGKIMSANSYYLIGGGGTFCATGVVPDLNVETCNCTGGDNNGAVGRDFMNFTNGSEGFGLFDCSNNFIDGVRWGSWAGDADGCPASIPAGCGNYLTAKIPVLPGAVQGAGLTNSGGGLSGTNGGRARDASGNWTVTVNNSQFGAGFNGTPKAVNGAFTMWDGSTANFGTQCPPPPVTATISVTLPDTCTQAGPTNITLKAIYRPDPVSPCSKSDVTASATYTIPMCEMLTLSGNGDYCLPATAPLSITTSSALVGNYDINLSNGANTASIAAVTGSGPFTTSVSNSGIWTISSVIPPFGTCTPRTAGNATVSINPIPAITSSPVSAHFCLYNGFDLSTLNAQIVTSPLTNLFEWYDQATGGSPITTLVNPSTTTTYYVAPTTGFPANCEGTRVPIDLIVDPIPVTPNVTCNGISATFTPQSPNCIPTPCTGIEYSADGLNWSANTTYTAADPGWAGWGSPLNSLLYIRNSTVNDCYNYVTYINPCTVPLPAELFNFRGRLLNSGNTELKWETANEINVSHFEIEKSHDKLNFIYTGKTIAKGNTAMNNLYDFIDTNPYEGSNYYRLKIMDIDQQYTYSNVIMIQKNVLNTSIAAVYPNPASNMIHIDLNIAKTEKTNIQVLDMTGRLVREFNVTLEKGFSTHQLDLASIANGQYMIRIPISNSVLLSKFTKQ